MALNHIHGILSCGINATPLKDYVLVKACATFVLQYDTFDRPVLTASFKLAWIHEFLESAIMYTIPATVSERKAKHKKPWRLKKERFNELNHHHSVLVSGWYWI